MELVWINYGWLDPSGKEYVGNHISAARLSRHDALLWAQI